MEGKVMFLLFLNLAALSWGSTALSWGSTIDQYGQAVPIARSLSPNTNTAMYMYMQENEGEIPISRAAAARTFLNSEKQVVADESNPSKSDLTTVYKANNQPISFKTPAAPSVKDNEKVKYVDEAYIASKYGGGTPAVKDDQNVKYVDEDYLASKYGGTTSFAKTETDAYTYIVVPNSNTRGTPIYKYVKAQRAEEEPTEYKYIIAPKTERTRTSNVYKYITVPKANAETTGQSYKYVIIPKSEPQETKYKFISPSETEPIYRYIAAPKQETEAPKYAIRYIDAPKAVRETSSPTIYKYIVTS